MTVIITGVSRGLGEALVQTFLAEGHEVTGIGRSCEITAPGFSFIRLDLSDWRQVEDFNFAPFPSGEVLLINNAGVLGEIRRTSSLDQDISGEVMQVNVVAPIQLTRKLARICGDSIPFALVNISSGAGQRPIPSWAAYCASKAALNLFSETFYLEEKELGRNTRVYAVSPGVIDTNMQQHIRTAPAEEFSSSDNFRNLKKNGELESPSRISGKLLKLLDKDFDGKVLQSLRDF